MARARSRSRKVRAREARARARKARLGGIWKCDYAVVVKLQRTMVEQDWAEQERRRARGSDLLSCWLRIARRDEMLIKEIESLAGLDFRDLNNSSFKTWEKVPASRPIMDSVFRKGWFSTRRSVKPIFRSFVMSRNEAW